MHNFPAKIILVLFFSLSINLAFSQANTNEPYSRYGFGILEPNYFGQSRTMGGVSAGMREDNTINIANPASYPSIRITTLESGFQASFISLRGNFNNEKSSNAQYSYLALGFPLSNKWSMVLAIVPYSKVGYTQSLIGTAPFLGPTTTTYSGEGGLTQAFMGHGFYLAKNLSIGLNLGYVFGNIQSSQSLGFKNAIGNGSDTIYNGRNTSTTQLGGFNFEYGAQYTLPIQKDSRITIGYTGSYGNPLNTQVKSYLSRYSSNSRGNEVILDTTASTLDIPKPSFLPNRNAFGLSYRFRNKLLVAADFDYDIYKQVIYDGTNPKFNNLLKGAIGIQYTPDLTSVSNYWDLIDYRAGFAYTKTNLVVNQKQINQYAITFGFGVPLRQYTQNQLGAKVNIGFEIGELGTINANNILQKYVNVHIGFVLNQLWFNRYRYQ